MDVSKNSGTPKSSILIGFSIINHPFWGTPMFGNIQIGGLLIWNPPSIELQIIVGAQVMLDHRCMVTYSYHVKTQNHISIHLKHPCWLYSFILIFNKGYESMPPTHPPHSLIVYISFKSVWSIFEGEKSELPALCIEVIPMDIASNFLDML